MKNEEVIYFESDSKLPKRSNVQDREAELIEILKIFSPGTSMRIALDDMMRARMGALIVVESEKIFEVIEGGFRINSKFTPQRLVELSKMDGAIILSKNLKKILYANTLLNPTIKVTTKETGTRHKAAERTAKEFNTLVIAVSERKNKTTLYFGDSKYILEETSELFRRAAETLQILEKQKEIFNDLLSRLNLLEINNLVMRSDVCSILREIETVRRIASSVRRYLVELGKEGMIVSMRLQELTRNMTKERNMILEDYFESKGGFVDETLKNLSFDSLLESSNILNLLFGETQDKTACAHGMRILSKVGLEESEMNILLENFKTIDEIFSLNEEPLLEAFKDEKVVKSLKNDLDNLKEKILVGKDI